MAGGGRLTENYRTWLLVLTLPSQAEGELRLGCNSTEASSGPKESSGAGRAPQSCCTLRPKSQNFMRHHRPFIGNRQSQGRGVILPKQLSLTQIKPTEVLSCRPSVATLPAAERTKTCWQRGNRATQALLERASDEISLRLS